MKKLLILTAIIAGTVSLQAETSDRITIEEGGPGPYKAEVVRDNKLDGYTIVRPADLKSAAAVEGPLPVILFGNGGCSRDAGAYLALLNNIASHGYIVLSNGLWERNLPRQAQAAPRQMQRQPQQKARQQQPQQAPARPQQSEEEMRKSMMDGFRQAEAQNVADAKDYLNALNWLAKESKDKDSEYYGLVDTENTAAMGQSCGGGQALILGCIGDHRIRTTVALNSGVAYLDDETTWMLTKEDLQNLSGPIVYLIGGREDVAYPNAADDYTRITKVPVAVANLPVGHMGTYFEKYGGSFADMALLWLDWQLKGHQENEYVFRYGEIPQYLAEEGWNIHSKNFGQDPIEIKLWDNKVESKETARRNDFGEVNTYFGVNDPSISVYLPDRDKANGTAALIFPGGGMTSLSWDGESIQVARWLNARGIVAICVKYRLRDMTAMARPAGNEPQRQMPDNKFLRMQGKIYDFGELVNANTNPSVPDPSDKSMENAAADAFRALDIIKEHASEWGIDPDKIGSIGFSAGGCVELEALMKADQAHTPAFMASLYGPANCDVVMKPYFPKLFIGVHADHPNVAAGCLALFLEWKKAGIPAEMHIYDENTGNLYGAAGSGKSNSLGGDWKDSFYAWLRANKFVD